VRRPDYQTYFSEFMLGHLMYVNDKDPVHNKGKKILVYRPII
jgi:hypothetical protein